MKVEPDRCITCGDTATTAIVVDLDGATAIVERDGRRERVGIELIEPVVRGDVLLCHAGIAIEKVTAR